MLLTISDLFVSEAKIYWICGGLLGTGVWLIKNYFNKGLNKYPGRRLASFTDWWRFNAVYQRKAHQTYLSLHDELGDVVRLGPNTLSFSNPQAVKDIYGLHNKLGKVSYRLLFAPPPASILMLTSSGRPRRAISIQSKCRSPRAKYSNPSSAHRIKITTRNYESLSAIPSP